MEGWKRGEEGWVEGWKRVKRGEGRMGGRVEG